MPPPLSAPFAASRRRTLARLAHLMVLPLAGAGAARAGYNIWTGEYTLDRATLQAAVERRFPVTRDLAGLAELRFANPRLALEPAANRLAITADVRLASALLAPAAVTGALAISSALRFDAPSRSVRLQDPRAERVELDGVVGEEARRLRAVGAGVARELLRDWPVHTFAPDELRLAGRALAVGAITVTPAGLVVEVR